MRTLQKSMIVRGLIFFHFMIMVALFLTCWMAFYRLPAEQGEYFLHNRTICAAYVLLLFTLSHVYDCYKIDLFRVSDLLYSQVLANLVSWGMTYVFACIMAQRFLNPLPGFAAFFVQCLVTVGWTSMTSKVYFCLHKAKRTIVIYRNERDLLKLDEVQRFQKRWCFVKRLQYQEAENDHQCQEGNALGDTTGEKGTGRIVGGDVEKLCAQLKNYEAVFVSGIHATLRNGIAKYCVENGKDCYFIPHTGDVLVSGATHIRSLSVPIFWTRRRKPTPESLFIKRAFDIVFSGMALVLLSPLLLATAIAIRQYDHGPVFYRQVRLTKDRKTFEILKFRSMRVDAEKDGVARLAAENDDRITPVGKVIRALRLDELPQLYNILKGDMSIVGPRPERPEIAEQYEKELPAFRLRLQVKAGLTGYAQVYGRYNTEPSDKLKMDLMYINNMGIMEDLKLMFATVRILFMKESTSGVSEGQMTAVKNVEKSA